MAWNEPGGSGGKDPWGSGGDEQGPPDLDELVKKLQKKLGGVFGGGAGGQGPSTGIGAGGLWAVVLGILALWAISGFYTVDEGTRAVVLQFGAYKKTERPGWHWYPRFIQSVSTIDVSRIRSAQLGYQSEEALMLTQDENIIDVKFDIQYRIKDDPLAARDYLFNVRDPDETLRQAAASAVREVIGKSTMDFVITEGRSVVTLDAQRLLQETLDLYHTGLVVLRFTMQEAKAPQQVKWAFDDVVKAREDEQRFKNQAETYSNEILPKARGQAARIVQEANAYKDKVIAEAEGETKRFNKVLGAYDKAPAVTRKRLYLDALQSVLSKSSKVVVDTKGSNNLLYLPLDKLMKQSGNSTEQEALSSLVNRDTDIKTSPSHGGSNIDNTPADGRSRDNARNREAR